MADIRNYIVSAPEVIQHKLLKSNELATFAHKHGLSILNKKHVIGLWSLGLLQADLIYSDSALDIDGLVLVENDDSAHYSYYDNRVIADQEDGWGGTLTKEIETFEGFELNFHPFRFYVLYNIQRVFEYQITPIQYLLDLNGAGRIVDWENTGLDKWTSSEEFTKKVRAWNQVVDLAVFVEPWAYGKIFNTVRWRFPDDFDSLSSKIDTRLVQINTVFAEIGLDGIEELREQLCIDVELLDDNKILHMLLRMMNANMRDNLKGRIGGAMLHFSMAEMLRLACENTFDKELKEEDELGFGVWMKDVKKKIYGANRLYDAKRTVKNEFIRQYGLDYGVRVRCYVEGETEAGALTSILGVSAGIEVKNLKGRVAEKGIAAFRDSLRQDIDSKIFSVIIIDSDKEKYVRAIRKAAQDDEICGLFFLSEPDIEFGNYNLDELAEIVVEYAKSRNIYYISAADVKENIQGAKSGKELMRNIQAKFLAINDISKGEEWGVLLMDYAARNPRYKPNENADEIERPINEVVNILLRCLSVGYQTTRTEYRVSPKTGKLIDR